MANHSVDTKIGKETFRSDKAKLEELVDTYNGLNSYDLFLLFVNFDGTTVDCSNIFGKHCFEAWVKSRKTLPAAPEDRFRKTLTAHITGTKRRRPFPPIIEESVLKMVRERKIWPAFVGRFDAQGKPITIGLSGFRAAGFHEQKTRSGKKVHIAKEECKDELEELKFDSSGNTSNGEYLRDISEVVALETKTNTESDTAQIPTGPGIINTSEMSPEDSVYLANLFLEIGAGDEVGQQGNTGSAVKRKHDSDVPNPLMEWFIDTMLHEEGGLGNNSKRTKSELTTKEAIDIAIANAYNEESTLPFMKECEQKWRSQPNAILKLCEILKLDEGSFHVLDPITGMYSAPTNPDFIELVFCKEAVTVTTSASIARLVCLLFDATYIVPLLVASSMATSIQKGVEQGLDLDECSLVKTDPRFAKEFRFAENLQFDESRPMGHAMYETVSNKCIFCDEQAQYILKGDFTGMTGRDISGSNILYWRSFTDIVPLLLVHKRVTFQTQTREVSGDRTPVLLRCKYELNENILSTTFQDVSHLYPDLATLPALP